MHISIPSNKSSVVSFKVDISGTSNAPQSVSVILEKDSASLSFVASKDGDEWTATIDNPGKMFGEGEVKLYIGVNLNNRFFVPLKGTADLVEEQQQQEEKEEPTSVDRKVDSVIIPEKTVETVEIKTVEKLQLLKSIEPGKSYTKPTQIIQSVKESVTASAFSIRRTKIVIK